MAILGQVIKSALEIKNALTADSQEVTQAQEAQLLSLLKKAKNTAFGIYYGFDQILKTASPIEAYRQKVPIHSYQQIHRRWWAQQQIHPNITWPGKPNYFALSSGTTGKKSKRIPITEEMLASFRSVSLAQAVSLAKFDLPPHLFEKEALMLGSSANLAERLDHLEGEISGINTSNLPSWFEGFYRPGLDIAKVDSWDERVELIAKQAPKWDVGAILGIPSWVQMMLEKIIEHNKLQNIHDIWPDLSLYISGGVAFEPYRESLEKLFDHSLLYLDTYLASEGFFAFTARPGTMSMQLALEHGIFYEFIPFDKRGFDGTGQLRADPLVLSIDQIEPDQDYALLISTPAGAWRYMIGDTIKFTNLDRREIIISGRTKYFLNVVGSQLSEEKINDAIAQVAKHFSTEITEYSVAAIRDEEGDYMHQWIIGNDQQLAEEAVAKQLDEALQDLNKNYRVARKKALKAIRTKVVPCSTIYNWLEARKKKGGQIKMPKVMKGDMMTDLLSFINAEQEIC